MAGETLKLGAIALLAGWCFDALQVPVGWLLGPMLAGMIYAVCREKHYAFPPVWGTLGQVTIALATANRFSLETLQLASTYAVPLLGCILITASLSLGNSYLLWRWAGIDRKTGLLACIPGVGASIVALSEEMGADAVTVALLQYLRIALVSFLVPMLVSVFFPGVAPGNASVSQGLSTTPMVPSGLNLMLLLGIGSLGVWTGQRLKLPAPLFLGPFLLGLLAMAIAPEASQVPEPVFMLGLMLMGLSIGLKCGWQMVRRLIRAVLIQIGLIVSLILMCLGVGYGFHVVTHVDAMTAVLGSTPGGLSAMMASVVQLGGDASLVLAMQITRMLLILLLTPCLASWLQTMRAADVETHGS
jgi:membrane AbrB-like protein